MSRPSKRPRPPEEVAFPVTPFLDMAFQLLAFFILTFRPPSPETILDLYLPSAPVALPESPRGEVKAPNLDDPDLDTDLLVHAEADANGSLASLRLGETPVDSVVDLETRLRKYAGLLKGKSLRVRLVAPDRLRFSHQCGRRRQGLAR
jgi:biopolymer transport protein ExbD